LKYFKAKMNSEIQDQEDVEKRKNGGGERAEEGTTGS
jgi:hypothetical protein